MNEEIKIMIELQHYWDNVMLCESEISRFNKSIQIWNKNREDLKNELQKKEALIKSQKLKSKEAESTLKEIEEKIKKLQLKKDSLKSEREIEAYQKELEKISADKDNCENFVLELMDRIDSLEDEISQLKIEWDETDKQVSNDIELIKSKIFLEEKKLAESKESFYALVEKLSPQSKTRFLKLIGSKDGKAIAKLNGEICGHCNFQIPSSLAAEVAKGEKIVSCTNCGRFIY
ncbi:MAG TPA: C4-type zinc ribbon domain-containing protein [Spirochaetota bacterium]|nr:C4-type zinc ribbon domain-containing protein [Spirochaetota bacterium]HPP94269.1 C4-type zinc ribbon domain-containing protein [Spirochaetota bacterium]